MTLTYDGKLGIGIVNPENDLHVVGTSTVTGNSWIGGDLSIDGDLTVNGSLNTATLVLPTIIDGSNISVVTGISTFNTILPTKIGINTGSPIVDIDAYNSTALVASVGIGTTNPIVDIDARISTALVASVGIGTTNTQGNQIYLNGKMSQYGGNFDIYDGSIHAVRSSVGIGTTLANAAVDFATAGKDISSGEGAYMIVPKLNSSEITGLSTVSGALIFNTSTSKFQGYDGTSWVNLH